jgi:phosphoribosylaminoimidazole-succinocarboxamide synthase
VLTQLSLWWFEYLADLMPNHVISATEVPDEWRGRAIRCRRLDMVKVECVARGYLTGSGLKEYQRLGAVCGIALPEGLTEESRLPEPIFTPTTKAPLGEHDQAITFDEVVAKEGKDRAEELRRLTLEIYRRGSDLARSRGIIIADTKVEFGSRRTALVLADEVLTPTRRVSGPRTAGVRRGPASVTSRWCATGPSVPAGTRRLGPAIG